MNKTFDCVEMKNQLQEKLYDEINPPDFDTYCEELNKKIRESSLYQEMKHKIKCRNTNAAR